MHAFLHVHDYKCDTCILCIHIYRYSSIYVRILMIAEISCIPLINWKRRVNFRCIGRNSCKITVPKLNTKKRQSVKLPIDISRRFISGDIRMQVQPYIMIPDKIPYDVIQRCPKGEGCMAGH